MPMLAPKSERAVQKPGDVRAVIVLIALVFIADLNYAAPPPGLYFFKWF